MLKHTDQPLKDPHLLPPLALAYVGDAVYELAVRRLLITTGTLKAHKLHKSAIKYVRAGSQAEIIHGIEDMLTEEEKSIVRRGRNAKSVTVPKGAGVMEYRHSTSFECLIGYLYLKGDINRLNEILEVAGKIATEL
ncbi:MAG: ribonuclease III [Firmicutes bacterium]|nr:ribonuclease III [Bacillota bacterium]